MSRTIAFPVRRLVLIVALALGGCVSVQGVGEFETYRSAYEKAYATGTQILDQLAVAEREAFLFLNPEASRAPVRNFDPKEASYFSDSVDPPGTAAFQRALDVIKSYNDLLYGLETGQTADALTAKIGLLETKTAAAVKSASSISSLSKLAPLTASINGVLAGLTPFINYGLRVRSRQQFRAYLVANVGPVKALIEELRDGTAVVFPTLTNGIERASFPRAFSKEQIEKIKAYRKLISDWVLLLDASSLALDRAVAAAQAPAAVEDVIGGLTASAIDVEAVANAASKHMAELAAK